MQSRLQRRKKCRSILKVDRVLVLRFVIGCDGLGFTCRFSSQLKLRELMDQSRKLTHSTTATVASDPNTLEEHFTLPQKAS